MDKNMVLCLMAFGAMVILQLISILFKKQNIRKSREILDKYFSHLPSRITAKFVRIERQAVRYGHVFYSLYEYNNQGITYLISVDWSEKIIDNPKPPATQVFNLPDDLGKFIQIVNPDGVNEFLQNYDFSKIVQKKNIGNNN